MGATIDLSKLSDKDLIKLYKKNSGEIINLLMILNAKENLEVVRELKKRGLFTFQEKHEEIDKEISKITKPEYKRLEEENITLQKRLDQEKTKKDKIYEYMDEYLYIVEVVNHIDKGEYFRKRNFNLSHENIEELDNLYSSLIDRLHTKYEGMNVKNIDLSEVIDYSVKYLDKNYKERWEELEDEEDPEPSPYRNFS